MRELIDRLTDHDAMLAHRRECLMKHAASMAADKALRQRRPWFGKRAYWKRHYDSAIAALECYADGDWVRNVHPRILVSYN